MSTRFPRLQNRVLYVVQYEDGREYINREKLTKAERAELKERGEKFREAKYRWVPRGSGS